MRYDRAMDDDIARRVYSDPVARWFVTKFLMGVDHFRGKGGKP